MDSPKRRRRKGELKGDPEEESVEVKIIENRVGEMEKERTDMLRELEKIRNENHWYRSKVNDVEKRLLHSESKHHKLKRKLFIE
jgi:uncharacterized protein (DUF3084 family)